MATRSRQLHVRADAAQMAKLREITESAPESAIVRAGLAQLELLADRGQAELVRRLVLDELIVPRPSAS